MEVLLIRHAIPIRRELESGIADPELAAEGLKQHRAVLNAMCKGNAELAEKLKRENIRSSRECLIRYQSFIL